MNSQHASQSLIISLFILFAACSDFEPATCSDGSRCPHGWTCSTDADNEFICTNVKCGNGILDTDEACDDGNIRSGDGCNAGCSSNETCGNAVIDKGVGETCDYGDREPGDGCSSTCQSEVCGNKILDIGEACDDGNSIAGDGCSQDCMSNESCGNGLLDEGEDCDCGKDPDLLNERDPHCETHNSDADGYCHNDCTLHCGDGKTSEAEECDDGVPLLRFCAEISQDTMTYDMGIVTECHSCRMNVEAQCKVLTHQSSSLPPETAPKLTAIMGSSVDNIFAVGRDSMALHYDGKVWAFEPTPPEATPDLFDVWWGSNSNIFAVGEGGTILQRKPSMEGPKWEGGSKTSATLYGIWGNNYGVYAVGTQGTILRRSGNSWSPELPAPLTTEDLYDVWGYSETVFAVGEKGTILRRHQGTWRIFPELTKNHLRGIWGKGRDIFIVGDDSTIIRIDATTNHWEPMKVDPKGIILQTIWGTSSNDVIAVGTSGHVFHYDGNQDGLWAPVRIDSQEDFHTAWTARKEPHSEAMIIGNQGAVLHFQYPYEQP